MSKPKPDEEMMTAAEVIKHIMRVERCSEREAVRQLHEALVGGGLPAYLPTRDGLKQLPPEAFSTGRPRKAH